MSRPAVTLQDKPFLNARAGSVKEHEIQAPAAAKQSLTEIAKGAFTPTWLWALETISDLLTLPMVGFHTPACVWTDLGWVRRATYHGYQDSASSLI
eukprot:CAMPEP_0172747196 /NCGR_PEP_ID=MMETSP1074-20121228/142239_1 /TAXON_ID=2916 /ORGANISM="Ceratium fusus, Strain PA161109" /LENGTH=95 /DNA_ID=CAMNT_0013578675 /DNA_START=164 /DNA_END=451 /DNA_ORIENTATION=+